MFYIRCAIKNIKRYKSKSTLNLLICIVIVILLNLFLGTLESNKQQLKDMSKVISLRAQISNLNGTLQTGLVINENVVEGILQSKYIANPSLLVVLAAYEGEIPKDGAKVRMSIDMAGITNTEAVTGITAKDITLAPNTSLSFLQTNSPTCIVEESFLKQNDWKIGQTITLAVCYDYRDKDYKYTFQDLKTEKFLIAGSVISTEGENIPQIIVPFQWAREAFKEKSIPFVVNAASFSIRDPLKLNEFKKEMHEELHILEINPASDYAFAGNAMAVNDETFIITASRIQDNIMMLSGFLPFILFIVVFIGYITSYLLIQNRRGQYATMRSLGVSSRMCFITLLMENFFIELVGGGIGIASSVLLSKQKSMMLFVVFGIFLLCFISGTIVALYQLGKVSVMKALAQKD